MTSHIICSPECDVPCPMQEIGRICPPLALARAELRKLIVLPADGAQLRSAV
jgi:hypothetical protein